MFPGFREPFPSRDPIVKASRKSADVFTKWNEQSLLQFLNQTPFRTQPAIVLPSVTASDSGTIAPDQTAGIYRVTAYREVIAADPVSSSLAITIGFTHNGKALTRTLSAFTGAPQTVNDTAGDVEVIEVDAGTPIAYTLTYASNTPGLAEFQVSLAAELIQTTE